MARLLLGLLFLLVTVSSAQQNAAASKDDFVVKLHGRWIGHGTVMKMSSQIEMIWEPALGSRFSRLTWRNTMFPGQGGTFEFAGDAYYQVAGDGKYTGQWFDSGGESHRLEAEVRGSRLITTWGDAAGKLGRTVYELSPDGGVAVVDSVRGKDGVWAEFGRTQFQRAE